MLGKLEYIINRIARSVLSPKLMRAIVDFPGVLRLNEIALGWLRVKVMTPDGHVLELNPLFHGQLASTEKVLNHEPAVRTAISRLVRPGMVAWDIGANVGIFTLQMAGLVGETGKVYAVEPEFNNFKHLRNSIAANRLTNTMALQLAIGQSRGVLQFDRRGGAFSGRLIDSQTCYKVTGNVVSVEVLSVDDMVFGNVAEPPDFMKIDIEGYESRAVLGMKKTLAQYSPVIICEVHTHLGDSFDEAGEVFAACGYTVFRIEDFLDGKLEPLGRIDSDCRIIALKNP